MGKFVVVGVSGNRLAINAVHRNGSGDGFEVIVAVQLKSEIILIAFLHEMLQLLLALLGKNVTANHHGKGKDKIV